MRTLLITLRAAWALPARTVFSASIWTSLRSQASTVTPPLTLVSRTSEPGFSGTVWLKWFFRVSAPAALTSRRPQTKGALLGSNLEISMRILLFEFRIKSTSTPLRPPAAKCCRRRRRSGLEEGSGPAPNRPEPCSLPGGGPGRGGTTDDGRSDGSPGGDAARGARRHRGAPAARPAGRGR